MSHKNLLGEWINDPQDYVDFAIHWIRSKPINPVSITETPTGVALETSVPIISQKGVTLFYNINDPLNPELIWLTFGDIQDRIYRFAKEQSGKSRKDESFPFVQRLNCNGDGKFALGYQAETFEELIRQGALPQDFNPEISFGQRIKAAMIDKVIYKK